MATTNSAACMCNLTCSQLRDRVREDAPQRDHRIRATRKRHDERSRVVRRIPQSPARLVHRHHDVLERRRTELHDSPRVLGQRQHRAETVERARENRCIPERHLRDDTHASACGSRSKATASTAIRRCPLLHSAVGEADPGKALRLERHQLVAGDPDELTDSAVADLHLEHSTCGCRLAAKDVSPMYTGTRLTA